VQDELMRSRDGAQTQIQDWGPVDISIDERTLEAWRGLPEPEPAPRDKDGEEPSGQ